MKISPVQGKFLGLKSDHLKIINTLDDFFTIDDISKKLHIPRTSLYYSLPYLLDRGFVTKKKFQKKILWKPSPLDEYHTNYVETLGIKSNFSNQKARVFTTAADIVSILYELTSLPKLSRIYGIQPHASLEWAVKKIPTQDLIQINKTVKDKGIIIEGLVHEDSIAFIDNAEVLKSIHGRSADTARMYHDVLKNTCAEIYLYDSTCAIINWKEEFAICIDDTDTYTLIKELFLQMKNKSGKYDQNNAIRGYLV